MTDTAATVAGNSVGIAARDAGFWRRAFALLIDVCIVAVGVSTVFLALALLAPDLGKLVTLNTPFGIGTVERTIETKSSERQEKDGVKVVTTDTLIERSVLDRWVYRFRIEKTARVSEGTTYVTTLSTETTQQVDPFTGQDMETASVDNIAAIVLLLYWILGDASRHQGTFGKRALGIKVVGHAGERLTLAAAAGRNVLKILSCLTLMIGFMMAGWTKRKQALHDKIMGTYVVVEQ
jgi:uncharacterized RDD family membrane protein YckC